MHFKLDYTLVIKHVTSQHHPQPAKTCQDNPQRAKTKPP